MLRALVISFCLWLLPKKLWAHEEFDRIKERAKMVALMENPQATRLQIEDFSAAQPQAQKFLSAFRDEYWPLMQELEMTARGLKLMRVALDRALYDSPAERESWEIRKKRLNIRMHEIKTSSLYKEGLKKTALFAEGLKGDVPDMMRRLYQQDLATGFGPGQMPVLKELAKLEAQITAIANNSPISPRLGNFVRRRQRLRQDFHEGRLSLAEASRQYRLLSTHSFFAHGQYIATTAGELINREAILKTKLAHSSGKSNWAEFQLSVQSQGYSSGYQTTQERIEFLRHFLHATRNTHEDLLKMRLEEIPGPQTVSLTPFENFFLELPDDGLMADYFPMERAAEVWRETMLESGFPQETLDRITWDSLPRTGKYSHAYMFPVVIPFPKILSVSAQSLNVARPRFDAENWFLAEIFIVQNIRSPGPNSWRTRFHEGGHGKDFASRADLLKSPSTSAFSETQSYIHEQLLHDPELLAAKLISSKGESAPRELIQKYLLNRELNELENLRNVFLSALFDLELWNFAFDETSESFIDRAKRLTEELSHEFLFVHDEIENGIDTRYLRFATNHFYSGRVEYIGYAYAKLAMKMTVDFLYDELERTTGRRTLFRQPGLADLLTEGYYRRGLERPFPESIETFTGRRYDVITMTEELNQKFQNRMSQYRRQRCSRFMEFENGHR